jgi:hypothetical protein
MYVYIAAAAEELSSDRRRNRVGGDAPSPNRVGEDLA